MVHEYQSCGGRTSPITMETTVRAIMWPDCLGKENWRRGKQRASSGKKRSEESETNYVSAPHLPGWLPVITKERTLPNPLNPLTVEKRQSHPRRVAR